jgi:orotate phosphoribosyltransferase
MVRLARPRSGHFDLGTGYHGDLWLDLDAMFLQPSRLRPHVRWLGERLTEHAVDAICGPLEGGAFLAYAVADLLGVAFLPGYRSPGEATGYHLPDVHGGISGWRVGIVDDAVNAGTAVAACLAELRGRGAVPVAVATLLSLGEASAMVPAHMGVPFYPASTVPSRAWPADQCPLCADRIPFTSLQAKGEPDPPAGQWWDGSGGTIRRRFRRAGRGPAGGGPFGLRGRAGPL